MYISNFTRKIIFLFGLLCTEVIAAESKCITELKTYENEYQLTETISDEKRLTYLQSIKPSCRDNALHAIFQSNVLIGKGKVDDAYSILDNAIANHSKPIGNVLYEKADLIQRMISAGYDSNSIHEDITYEESIHLFKQALKTKTNVIPLVYLGLAEVHIAINELEKAVEYANLGIQLDNNIARLYSLLGIIASKKNDFQNTIHLVSFCFFVELLY